MILTHGGQARPEKTVQQPIKDVIYGTDGKAVDTSVIIDLFNDDKCQALKNKPRLFFLQVSADFKLDLIL